MYFPRWLQALSRRHGFTSEHVTQVSCVGGPPGSQFGDRSMTVAWCVNEGDLQPKVQGTLTVSVSPDEYAAAFAELNAP